MLKYEPLKVNVDGFVVTEIDSESSADFYDKTRTELGTVSDGKLAVLMTREYFVHRVLSWPEGLGECSDEAKRTFFKSYTGKANEILKNAKKEIEKKRAESLKNLLAGAAGS